MRVLNNIEKSGGRDGCISVVRTMTRKEAKALLHRSEYLEITPEKVTPSKKE